MPCWNIEKPMRQFPIEWPPDPVPTHFCASCGEPILVMSVGSGDIYLIWPNGRNLRIKFCPKCGRKLAGGGVMTSPPVGERGKP